MLILLQETTGVQETANKDALPNNPLSAIQIVPVLSLIALIALVVVVVVGYAVARRNVTQGRPWLDYGNFFVVACGLVVIIIGYLSLLLFLNQFESGAQVLGYFAALTGATVGLVGTYFGIKTSSDTVEVFARNGTAPLTVTAITPRENAPDAPPNTPVTAQFSRAVDPTSISPNTFQVLSFPGRGPVEGNRVPDAQNTRVTFTQANPLAPGDYQATITTGVRDQSGNQLAAEKTWTFTVVPAAG